MNVVPQPGKARLPILVRARIAVSAAFFLLGFAPGMWAAHLPVIAARLDIDPGTVGMVLFTLAVGAVGAMPILGWATGRFGSRMPLAASLLAYTIITPLLIIAPNLTVLFLTAAGLGFSMAGIDVAGNVHAVEVETARGAPTMSSFHAFYSVGNLAGAGTGAVVIAIGWGQGGGAMIAAAFLLALAIAAGANLLPRESGVAEEGPRFALPSRAVIGLGILAFLCFAVEGAVTDWSTLYMTSVKDATPAAAATVFAFYALAMTIFRLIGDGLVLRFGVKAIQVWGGILIAAGLVLAMLLPGIVAPTIGFVLVGAGAANVVPVLFSLSARWPGVSPGLGVAVVATLGYGGFLIMPPILGFVGRAWGLTASLSLVAVMGLVIAIGAAGGPREAAKP